MESQTGKKRGRPVDPALQERRREQILEAAARLFARHGYPRTDVQMVADELGIGKGTVYRYFNTKEDLFLAAVDRGLNILRGQVDAMPEDLDPLELIRRVTRTYLQFFKDNPHYAELMIQERAEFRDRKQHTYFANREADSCRWTAMFARLIEQGRFRAIPVQRILDVLGDLLYGTMFTNHFSGRHKPLETQAEDIIDVVFHGILTEQERKKETP